MPRSPRSGAQASGNKPFNRNKYVEGLAKRNGGAFRDEFFRLSNEDETRGLHSLRVFVWKALGGYIAATIRRARGASSVAAGALWSGSMLFEGYWLRPTEADTDELLGRKLRLARWLMIVTKDAAELENQDSRVLGTDIHMAATRCVRLLEAKGVNEFNPGKKGTVLLEARHDVRTANQDRTLFDTLDDQTDLESGAT